MPGLDPGICDRSALDRRVKPGDDGLLVYCTSRPSRLMIALISA
jgi:hypothetical protein